MKDLFASPEFTHPENEQLDVWDEHTSALPVDAAFEAQLLVACDTVEDASLQELEARDEEICRQMAAAASVADPQIGGDGLRAPRPASSGEAKRQELADLPIELASRLFADLRVLDRMTPLDRFMEFSGHRELSRTMDRYPLFTVNQLRALDRPAEYSSSIMMHRELATTVDCDPLPMENAINQPGIIELRSVAFVSREFAPMIALDDAERALPRNLNDDLRSEERLILSAPRLIPRDDRVLLYVVAHGSPVSRISDDPVTIERGLPPGSARLPRFGPCAEAVLRVLAYEARGENSRRPALEFESVRRRLGTRIRALRAARKLTQEMVADRIDLSQKCVSELERGQRSPSWETLIAIAHQGFEIKLASLMFGIDEDIDAEVQGLSRTLGRMTSRLRRVEVDRIAGRRPDRTGLAGPEGGGKIPSGSTR